jgi:hypothetical protein
MTLKKDSKWTGTAAVIKHCLAYATTIETARRFGTVVQQDHD